jgi:CrcB protein
MAPISKGANLLVLIGVTLGSGLGGLARYGLSNLVHGDTLPWVTVAINVAGSFLLGVLVVIPAAWLGEDGREVIGVGLLGGFTTFSTFSVQAFLDFEVGEPGRALLYITASVVLGIAAAAAGYYAARAIVH